VRYPAWTFDDTVPGPVIRARVGDWLEVHHTNLDTTGIGHNVDFHAVLGPGGGAPALYAETGETRAALFKLTYPGAFIYHCAAAPLPAHIANGMYGMLIVDPASGHLPSPQTLLSREDLHGPQKKSGPRATSAAAPHLSSTLLPEPTRRTSDGRPLREIAVIQSEFYFSEPEDSDDSGAGGLASFDYRAGLDETTTAVVFNGREGALTERPILVSQGDRVRLYFGNAGPNSVSSLHLIGSIFDAVWRDGDVTNPPARGLQTVCVPPGGTAIVEFDAVVPGSLSLVDHAIFRVDKGVVGFIKVVPRGGGVGGGANARPDLYASAQPPVFCPGCKLHN
jgi:FtsP/CotA-like multicopper oxidase with cupredoxin domain